MEGLKNIVVLKNLPSNLIEEAFVVVKPNIKIDKIENDDKNTKENYVIKEAESVILNYLENLKNTKEKNKIQNIEGKYKKLKALTIWLGLVAILGGIINFI